MNKILSFIVNENNELLLLKENPNDSQFKESFWYVVTGECETTDITKEYTVRREIKEETGLTIINKIMYLNWILKYISNGIECTEYVYITFVKSTKIILNEENIEYKWCTFEEFMNQINWFGDKKELTKVLKNALNNKLYLKKETTAML